MAICQKLGQKERVGLRHFWLGQTARERGDYEQARTHHEQCLVIMRAVGNQMLVARTLYSLGWIARTMGDLAQAAALFEESLVVYRELGMKGGPFAEALTGLAIVASAQGDRKMVQALVEEGMALSRNDELETAIISIDQGHLLLEGGHYAVARSRFEEGLAARRVVQDTRFIAWALLEAGHAAWLQEDNTAAQSHAVEGLRLFHDVGNRSGMLAALESLAVVALAQGRRERATRVMGGAAALREAQGFVPDWWLRCRERIAEAVRAAALERECAAAWAEGRGMSLEEAVSYALEECGSA